MPHLHRSSVSPSSNGPLPKSDSVQSLVSLMNCSSGHSTANLEDSTIRAVDTNAETHSIVVTPETESISLSGYALKTIALTALHSTAISRSLREISLAANDLEVVDLTPLKSCTSLTALSLSSNRITSLDLSSLQFCTQLERLWLHDNCLEFIDLSPISYCKSLRSIYLEDNSLHAVTLDLSPLASTKNLRCLRLGGNRLGGKLDLSPLLLCAGLSVFHIDSSVSLVSDGDSCHARVCPALRRIVLDIKFTGTPVSVSKKTHTNQVTPPVSPESAASTDTLTDKVPPPRRSSPPVMNKLVKPVPHPLIVIKILLVGFRRLARYAAEDCLSRCGKVIIRAADQRVASSNPALLLDSHIIILYAPLEKTMRQVTVVVGRIPTVVIGSQRYRSTAEGNMLRLLDTFNFYADPMNPEDSLAVYNKGKDYAIGANSKPSTLTTGVESALPLAASSSLVSEEDSNMAGGKRNVIRKSFSESALLESCGSGKIELEYIEDEDPITSRGMDSAHCVRRSVSAERISSKPSCSSDIAQVPVTMWTEVTRRLKERKGKRGGRGWGSYNESEMSMHGRNKLRAEQAAVEVAFYDLGGYATVDSCTAVSRACGLPKCAGPALFKAAFRSSFEIESTTPEAGVPNPPQERKTRRISVEAFTVYWKSRLKEFDGEERLSNVLEDSYNAHCNTHSGWEGQTSGHSRYGAPLPGRTMSTGTLPAIDEYTLRRYLRPDTVDGSCGNNLIRVTSVKSMSTDISCPCDSGIESLISAFMEGRSSRFGSFSLVKISEAVAIGSSLVMYGLRGTSNNRVGGLARPVSPKEVRGGKLNSALIAAEAGIFEGVASGLAMDQIRSVKGCFATEASPDAVSRHAGLALSYSLTVEDVQRFCIARKTLLPGAVERAMAVHCQNKKEMSLDEFSVFLSVLNNITSNGAVDYFFTVADMDQNDWLTLPDLRHFHLEKERMWLCHGMALSELVDVWMNMLDMIQPEEPSKGISRRDLRKLGAKDRKFVLQSLLFLDDDHTMLNIRKTMELDEKSSNLMLV